MKTSLISLAAFVGLVIGSLVGAADANVPTSSQSQVSSNQNDSVFTVDIGQVSQEVTMKETTVVGYRAPVAHHHTASKVWTCGNFYVNRVGGTNRDCKFQ